jgi:hypothetical protein
MPKSGIILRIISCARSLSILEDPEAEKTFRLTGRYRDAEQPNRFRRSTMNFIPDKLLEVFKTNIPLEEKEISYEEFITLASAKHDHGAHA